MVHQVELLEAVHSAFDMTVIVMFWASHPVRIVLLDTETIGGWLVTQLVSPTAMRTVSRTAANPFSLNDLRLFIVLYIFIVIEAILQLR